MGKVKIPLCIYVDHGEAYGNLGDEAMLFNALRRLNHYLGPCEFILPGEPHKPLPMWLPSVRTVFSPRLTIAKLARYFMMPFDRARRIPLLWRLVPSLREATFWRWATKWLNFRAALSRAGIFHSTSKGLEPFVRAIRDCDAFYGVGAADFSDFWLEGVVYKSWLYTIVSRYVKVSAVSAQGIGPLSTEWARRMMGRAFAKLDLLSFRDYSLSESIVDGESPAHVRYRIVGDEAFTLPSGEPNDAKILLRESKLPKGSSFIAVHFRCTDYTQDTTFLIPRIARMLDEIAEATPHYFVFFPMSYHLHSGFDKEYGCSIQSCMSQPERLLIAPVCRDAQTVKGAVGIAKYSLGSSYHIHVFSLSQGHPAVILYTGGYYKCKSEGLVDFYGSPNIAVDLSQVNNSQIVRRIREVEDSYEAVCESISRVNEELLKHNDWTLREMASLLDRDRDCHPSEHHIAIASQGDGIDW